jgi:hypothetical protein
VSNEQKVSEQPSERMGEVGEIIKEKEKKYSPGDPQMIQRPP